MLIPLVVMLLQTGSSYCGLPFYNGFYYDRVMNDKGDGNGEGKRCVGVLLMVETSQDAVFSLRGANVTLPCRYYYLPKLDAPRMIRIKWSKLKEDSTRDADVLVSSGLKHRSFGDFRGRTRLQRSAPHEVSLVIGDLRLRDAGKYRCEVIDGLEDESGTVDLELQGECYITHL
uniref:Ig-like domain-containing protein n=1 Tax=Anolis carolinensis TaxID=28377 RepID=H9G3M4_ANOCA